jgi:hypothetical protein
MNGLHTIDFHTAAFQPRFFACFMPYIGAITLTIGIKRGYLAG